MSSDKLNVEVAELLEKTDSLLNSPVGGPSLSDTGRSSGSSKRLNLPPARHGRSITRASSQRSTVDVGAGADEYSDAGSRLRDSFDAATRKFLALKKTASFKEPLSVDIPRKVTSTDREAPTPRLKDALGSRSTPSISLTDPSTTLERSASMTLTSNQRDTSAGGTGRTYNSFAGLQDMVSMVDELVAASAAGSTQNAAPEARYGSPGRLGVGSRGTSVVAGLEARTAPGGLRSSSPSRLGSPSRLSGSPLRPSSPLRKSSGVYVPPAATPSPSSKGSRRAQLQALLSKDLAQPEEVIKFKAEAAAQACSPVNVAALTGNLQEKFEQVQRKLKNWDLVETVARERFNTAMDAALDDIFSRVNLAWPSSDAPSSGAPASASGRPSSKGVSRESERQQNGSKVDASSDRHHRMPGGDLAEADGHWGSPESSASKGYAWDEVSSSTTDLDEDKHRSSDSEISGGGGLAGHAHSRGSKHRGQARGLGSGPAAHSSKRREGSTACASSQGRGTSSRHGAGRPTAPDLPRFNAAESGQGYSLPMDVGGAQGHVAYNPSAPPAAPNGAAHVGNPAAGQLPVPAYSYYTQPHAFAMSYGSARPGSSMQSSLQQAPSMGAQPVQQAVPYPMASVAPLGTSFPPHYPYPVGPAADGGVAPAQGHVGTGLEHWVLDDHLSSQTAALGSRASIPVAWTFPGQTAVLQAPPFGTLPPFEGGDSGGAMYHGLPPGASYTSLSAPNGAQLPPTHTAAVNMSPSHMLYKAQPSYGLQARGGGGPMGIPMTGTYGYMRSPQSPTQHRYGVDSANLGRNPGVPVTPCPL